VSAVIEIENLTKVYEGAIKSQDVVALKDLTVSIDEGEIFAYLGPNGSGKTTTIKLLLGLIFPTAGKMKILGTSDVTSPAVRRNIGYLPEGAYYPDFLKGEEVLRFYGHLYGLSGKSLETRIDRVLDEVGMTRARKRLIRGYSKGMRQRIGLAQALISDPQILILDEPTTGLDPIARKEIRDILQRLRDAGKTLFISSHELLEVELISNRVAILYEGVLQTSGTLAELLADRDITIQTESVSPEALEGIKNTGATPDDHTADQITWRVPSGVSIYDVLSACKAHDASLTSIAPQRETLEELFVRVVGEAGGQKG
jgi:ABC-2 type transport system ATP-binding protein